MNEIVSKREQEQESRRELYAWNVIADIQDLHIVLVDHLQKAKKEPKKFKEAGDSP